MGYSDKSWYVGSSKEYYPCALLFKMNIYIKYIFLHISSDLLVTKKANIQSTVWDTVMKLSM